MTAVIVRFVFTPAELAVTVGSLLAIGYGGGSLVEVWWRRRRRRDVLREVDAWTAFRDEQRRAS